MDHDKPLTCECGVQAFRNIQFPEPGIMYVTCFHCGRVYDVSLSAIAAEAAWERMEREAPEPQVRVGRVYVEGSIVLPDGTKCVRLAEPEPTKPTGYKYEPML
jgi:hypothetical protein